MDVASSWCADFRPGVGSGVRCGAGQAGQAGRLLSRRPVGGVVWTRRDDGLGVT